MNKSIVIVDYNLSRLADVKMMTDYARSRYGMASVMIRSCPGETDRQLADHVVDLDPLDPHFVRKAADALASIRTEIVAVLPFSDNAVKSGAELARFVGVKCDSPVLAQAAFSKIDYREKEKILSPFLKEQGIFTPRSEKVRTLADIRRFAAVSPHFVLKPSCEGNNRGVLKLQSGDDLETALAEVALYVSGGLICEELIPFTEEFSYDGIGHLNFVTEKMSLNARYPVEYGQIVPALGSQDKLGAIRKAGSAANLICGQKIGPFHNEIKYDPNFGMAAVIEPNRRPAGMKIWHLANKVYGVNFFEMWIDQLVTGLIPDELPAPKGRAAIRMLPAPRDGILMRSFSDQAALQEILARILKECRKNPSFKDHEIEWYGFNVSAKSGTRVSQTASDNSGFIGEICAFSPDLNFEFETLFGVFENAWKEILSEHVFSERSAHENLSVA